MEKRTYSDRREYNIQSVKKRRLLLRKMAVEYKGGKCTQCGCNKDYKALDFHHINEATKEFGLSDRGMTRSWEKIRQEVSKALAIPGEVKVTAIREFRAVSSEFS